MAKEKLEKEATEYANENKEVYGSDEYADITDYNNIKEAYLAGAEPREKRIVELETQIEKMKCCGNCENEDDDSWHDSPCDGCENYTHWKLRGNKTCG